MIHEYTEHRCETCANSYCSKDGTALFCKAMLDCLPRYAPLVGGGVAVEPFECCPEYEARDGYELPILADAFNGVQKGEDYSASLGR